MPRALQPGEIDIYYLDPEAHRARADALAGWLTEAERARWQRFAVENPRLEYLLSRVLVRRGLSQFAAVRPEAWEFELGAHGRPRLTRPTLAVHFNLTHTRGLIALAVGSTPELGIDAEALDRHAPLEVADHFFAADEAAALRSLAPSDQTERFFSLWTLKEAYLKARSEGLTTPLEHFSVFPGERPTLVVRPPLLDDPARWQLLQLKPTPRHLIGLAVADAPSLTVRERWVDLADEQWR